MNPRLKFLKRKMHSVIENRLMKFCVKIRMPTEYLVYSSFYPSACNANIFLPSASKVSFKITVIP